MGYCHFREHPRSVVEVSPGEALGAVVAVTSNEVSNGQSVKHNDGPV
jgi:hypothetical protein